MTPIATECRLLEQHRDITCKIVVLKARADEIVAEPEALRTVPDLNPVIGICGECGLEIRQVMGYYCPNPVCPCFPRWLY